MVRIVSCALILLFALGPHAGSATDPQDAALRPRLSDLLGDEEQAGFAKALEPRMFSFPADHGPHPEFRNEWWYFTGNIEGTTGRRFGFELTFFRFALAPQQPPSESAWRTNQVYMAHFALTDAAEGRFYVAQRYSRGAVGLAGARAAPFRVWLEDWEVAGVAGGHGWRLVAEDDDFAVDLGLVPLRQPVLHGEGGLSRKSSLAGTASYYYSITRLETGGTVRLGDDEYGVSGLSWLDREWSTSALAPDQAGWDWFALQLSDGSDLMFYSLRGKDGGRDEASAGSWVSAAGDVAGLTRRDIEITVLDHWASPQGGVYPARWRLRVPRLELDVTVTPVLADQELITLVRYWEGAVDVVGEHRGEPVTGRGYVELTGYAQ